MRRAQFKQDAQRWESGELSSANFAAGHPETHVQSMIALHERLSSVRIPDYPATEAGWDAVSARLPQRTTTEPAPSGFRLRRPLVAAFAIMLISASVAYAGGVKPVRHGVDTLVRSITHIFQGTMPSSPHRDPAHPVPATTSSESPAAGFPGGTNTGLPTPDAGQPDAGQSDGESGHPGSHESDGISGDTSGDSGSNDPGDTSGGDVHESANPAPDSVENQDSSDVRGSASGDASSSPEPSSSGSSGGDPTDPGTS